MAQADWKPFHESILASIAEMTVNSDAVLRRLIKTTTIPKNWDAIADAWDKRMSEIYPSTASALDDVRQSLMEQKTKAAQLKPRIEPDHGEGLGL